MTDNSFSAQKNSPDISVLSSMYRLMLRIRMAELKVAEIYPTDKIQSPVHLSVGQEAVAAGVCMAMNKGDVIYATYRSHGIYIAKGGDLGQMFAELYGKDTGCARGKGGSMHMIATHMGFMGSSAIVASTIPLATGHALAFKMQRKPHIAVAFFGDGAVDEGTFYESLNFAALKNLPVLFVCENNNYAVHSKVLDRHQQTELFRLGEGLGIKGQRFDGNDANVVYRSMREASRKVRDGSGPFLLEYMTYRLFEHVGTAQDLFESYRDRGRSEWARANDPIERGKQTLREHGITDKSLADIESEVRQEIEQAVQFAESSPFPAPDRLYEDLFEERR